MSLSKAGKLKRERDVGGSQAAARGAHAPKAPAAAALAGCQVAQASQGEDVVPGARGPVQRLLGGGGLL